MHYHNDSIVNALTELFPEIGLMKVKFLAQCNLFRYLFFLFINKITAPWSSKESRVQFLEKFAADNKFDPLVAANWYKIRRESFLAVKVLFSSSFPFFFWNYFKRESGSPIRTRLLR